jgi:hypothetical protein
MHLSADGVLVELVEGRACTFSCIPVNNILCIIFVNFSLQRSSVFKWMAAVSVDLGGDNLPEFLPLMLPPLFKVITDTSSVAGKICNLS